MLGMNWHALAPNMWILEPNSAWDKDYRQESTVCTVILPQRLFYKANLQQDEPNRWARRLITELRSYGWDNPVVFVIVFDNQDDAVRFRFYHPAIKASSGKVLEEIPTRDKEQQQETQLLFDWANPAP